jgi:hypothetical protein
MSACAAIAALRAWERGELPMTACRAAAFAAHAAERDATETVGGGDHIGPR